MQLRLRPRSLARRQLLVSLIGLPIFLALVGFALDSAFARVAEEGVRTRLANFAMAYAANTEMDGSGTVVPPVFVPDSRLSRPGSGLYAQLVQGALHWHALSGSGMNLPELPALARNQEVFHSMPVPAGPGQAFGSDVYVYGRGFAWTNGPGKGQEWSVYVMEDQRPLRAQLNTFRKELWSNLLVAAALLLSLQMVALYWSLKPLGRVRDELERVKSGKAELLTGHHPRELTPLTESINALIESERRNRERQQHLMSDLAHSLKTPLAVLRTQLESDAPDAMLRHELDRQLQRMNEIVGYQLGRARTAASNLYAAAIEIEPHALDIVTGLEKIYAAKGVLCEFEIAPDARFLGAPGDLQELLGNLLENAFKWATTRVLLSAQPIAATGTARAGVRLMVEDDGPGIAPGQVEKVLERGVRGDERVQGHGIGLSIVQDIIAGQGGALSVERSEELGGARFVVELPPH